MNENLPAAVLTFTLSGSIGALCDVLANFSNFSGDPATATVLMPTVLGTLGAAVLLGFGDDTDDVGDVEAEPHATTEGGAA